MQVYTFTESELGQFVNQAKDELAVQLNLLQLDDVAIVVCKPSFLGRIAKLLWAGEYDDKLRFVILKRLSAKP